VTVLISFESEASFELNAYELRIGEGSVINMDNFSIAAEKMIFEIFGDGGCGRITATKSIDLQRETVLEIVAARGTYKKNTNYDIMVLKNSSGGITGVNNIKKVTFSPSSSFGNSFFHTGLYNSDRNYRIVIDEDIIVLGDSENMITLPISEFTKEELKILEAFNKIYKENPRAKLEKILIALGTSSGEDRKIFISQISPKLIADVISSSLLLAISNPFDSNLKFENTSKNELWLKPIYRNIKLTDRAAEGSTKGLVLGTSRRLEKSIIGFHGSLETHSLEENLDDRATVMTLALGILGETTVLNNSLDLALKLGFRANSYTINKNIEKLNKTLNYKFFSPIPSLAMQVQKKFKCNDFIVASPFLGFNTAVLAYIDLSEEIEGTVNFEITAERRMITFIFLGVTLAAESDKLNSFLTIEGKFPVFTDNLTIKANLRGYPEDEFEATGSEFSKFTLAVAAGIKYQLTKNINLNLESNYLGNSSQRILGVGFGFV
jgi:hypothetical protein